MAKGKELQPVEETPSGRFSAMVMSEYQSAVAGKMKMDPYQKKLAQHLFVKIDMSLKEAELRRKENRNQTAITWANVNMQKLALDAVHRIELGLDGLVPNHIWPIAYKNSRTGKYDLDLRIGYAGKDYYYRKLSLYPIVDITYRLVCDTDKFTVIEKSLNNGIESYTMEIPKPFSRGQVLGGFGYIQYEDERRNQLVLVSNSDFNKSKAAAKSQDFWTKHPEEMKLKTVVHRTIKRIVLDPAKINDSYVQVESNENGIQPMGVELGVDQEIKDYANSEVIDIEQPEPPKVAPKPQEQQPGPDGLTDDEKAEILRMEADAAIEESRPKTNKPPF